MFKSRTIDSNFSDAFESIKKGISSQSADLRKQATAEFYHLSGVLDELRPQVERGIKDFVHRAGDASEVYGTQARDIAARRKVDIEEQIKERPWTFIAGGILIGLLFGLFRSSRYT